LERKKTKNKTKQRYAQQLMAALSNLRFAPVGMQPALLRANMILQDNMKNITINNVPFFTGYQ